MNQNLTGKTVLVMKKCFSGLLGERKFVCEDGFGCHPMTNGTKVYGYWKHNNQQDCINGYQIEKILK